MRVGSKRKKKSNGKSNSVQRCEQPKNVSGRGCRRKNKPQGRRDDGDVPAPMPWRPPSLHSAKRRPLRRPSCGHRLCPWRPPPPHRPYNHNAQQRKGDFPSTTQFHCTSCGRELLHRILCQRWRILHCTTIQLFSLIYFHLDLET